jgi:hypothetical protein
VSARGNGQVNKIHAWGVNPWFCYPTRSQTETSPYKGAIEKIALVATGNQSIEDFSDELELILRPARETAEMMLRVAADKTTAMHNAAAQRAAELEAEALERAKRIVQEAPETAGPEDRRIATRSRP